MNGRVKGFCMKLRNGGKCRRVYICLFSTRRCVTTIICRYKMHACCTQSSLITHSFWKKFLCMGFMLNCSLMRHPRQAISTIAEEQHRAHIHPGNLASKLLCIIQILNCNPWTSAIRELLFQVCCTCSWKCTLLHMYPHYTSKQ